jgi:acyl carrier protein
MTRLADEILAVLCKIAPDIAPGSVDPAKPLPDQLDLDSMDYQTFLASLSTRYAIEIKEVDVPALRSINDLVAYVETHRA